MQRLGYILGLAAMVVALRIECAYGDDTAYRWEEVPGKSVSLVGPGGVMWRHNHAVDQAKPFFDPVGLVTGESLSWNAPPDHAWHHGLWFSWHTINGVNYWEHEPGTGKPRGRTTWTPPLIRTEPDGRAILELRLTYAPIESPPVMHERRIIEIAGPSESGCYSFDWSAEFRPAQHTVKLACTPIPPHKEGKPWGGYAGLSFRGARVLVDRKVVTDVEEALFDQDGIYRSRAMACDYQGTINGREAGIAFFSHPENPRNPTPWYAIRSEMSYLNAAFLQNEPFTIEEGDALHLRYRIIVHPNHWDIGRLKEQANRWQ